MANRNCKESDTANPHRSPQRDDTPVADWQTAKHLPRRRSRIDRTRSTLDKASGVIVVRMRQNDGRRRDGAQTMQPVRPAVDHDAGTVLLHQQRAVALMSA